MLFQILSNAFERSKWMYNLYCDDCFNIISSKKEWEHNPHSLF